MWRRGLREGAWFSGCGGVALRVLGRGFVGAEAWLLSGGVAICVEGVVFEWGVAECRGVAFCVGAGLCECEGVALEWGRGFVGAEAWLLSGGVAFKWRRGF